MPRARSRRPSRQLSPLPMPVMWELWIAQRFGARPQLAKQLWYVFARQASPEQAYLLRQAQRLDGVGPLEALLRVITPATLLDLTLQVAPEGYPRPLEIRRLEARILEESTRGDGSWL